MRRQAVVWRAHALPAHIVTTNGRVEFDRIGIAPPEAVSSSR